MEMKYNIGKDNPMFGKHGKEHPLFGKHINVGESNNQWKGNNVGYPGLHTWIKRHKPKPKVCDICKVKQPYDCANISGKYKRDINDFRWLCRSCHMKSDGRLNKLHERNKTDGGNN